MSDKRTITIRFLLAIAFVMSVALYDSARAEEEPNEVSKELRGKTVGVLRQTLEHQHRWVKVHAAESLAKLGYTIRRQGDEQFERAARPDTGLSAMFTRWVLANSGDEEAILRLAEPLESDDTDTRKIAAYALRHLPSVPPAVCEKLATAAQRVRRRSRRQPLGNLLQGRQPAYRAAVRAVLHGHVRPLGHRVWNDCRRGVRPGHRRGRQLLGRDDRHKGHQLSLGNAAGAFCTSPRRVDRQPCAGRLRFRVVQARRPNKYQHTKAADSNLGLIPGVRYQRHEPGALDCSGDGMLAGGRTAGFATRDDLALPIGEFFQ